MWLRSVSNHKGGERRGGDGEGGAPGTRTPEHVQTGEWYDRVLVTCHGVFDAAL